MKKIIIPIVLMISFTGLFGHPIFPSDIQILNISVQDNMLTLNVSEEILNTSGSSHDEYYILKLIQKTAEFHNIDDITLLVNGEIAIFPKGSFLKP